MRTDGNVGGIRPARSKRRFARTERVILWLLLAVFSYGVLELTIWAGLLVLGFTGHLTEPDASDLTLGPDQRERIEKWVSRDTLYYMHSPLLGWTIKPNGEAHHYRSNRQGLRADRDYTLEPPAGLIRLASFGDSFTHGADVRHEESWQQKLEEFDSHLEVLNFGVDAYGLDQSFLRYSKEGPPFQPHIVLVGLMSENINRSVSVFRPFYQPWTGAPFAKPRFVFDENKLRLIPNPISDIEDYRALLADTEATMRTLGESDHYFHAQDARRSEHRLPSLRLYRAVSKTLSGKDPLSPGFTHGVYDTNSETYRVTTSLLDNFCLAALEDGSLPIVLLFPNRTDMARYGRKQKTSYQPLIDHLEEVGFGWIDLLEPLSHFDSAILFNDSGHYSPAGNQEVALAILAYLRFHRLTTLSEIEEHLASERVRPD